MSNEGLSDWRALACRTSDTDNADARWSLKVDEVNLRSSLCSTCPRHHQRQRQSVLWTERSCRQYNAAVGRRRAACYHAVGGLRCCCRRRCRSAGLAVSIAHHWWRHKRKSVRRGSWCVTPRTGGSCWLSHLRFTIATLYGVHSTTSEHNKWRHAAACGLL